MNPRERGFLLLCGKLGDPERKPLTTAQLRLLAQRAAFLPPPEEEARLSLEHLRSIGIERTLSEHILSLLDDELQLDAYLKRGEKNGCVPLARVSKDYPPILHRRLGFDAPGCLWVKGDLNLLKMPAVSLVGSRVLKGQNRRFAREVGIQAAKQGFALVSGNAAGADTSAQNACMEAGGCVISVVADALTEHPSEKNVLYVSEEDFDEVFTVPRALHRNHSIHAWGEITFVAQCTLEKGGTWNGSVQNLRKKWSPVFCLKDGSAASLALEGLGATLITPEALQDFKSLSQNQISFL